MDRFNKFWHIPVLAGTSIILGADFFNNSNKHKHCTVAENDIGASKMQNNIFVHIAKILHSFSSELRTDFDKNFCAF